MRPLHLVAVAAEGGPAGGPAAFHRLEQALVTLKGRRFYGVATPLKEGVAYHAAAEAADAHEASRLNLEPLKVQAGEWLQHKMFDWKGVAHTIGDTIDRIASTHTIDHGRPTLEFYRSERELRLLIPVITNHQKR